MSQRVPQKVIYPIPDEELGSRLDQNVEIKIKDCGVLQNVMTAMMARLQNNGHRGIHCFFIDTRWILPSEGYRVKIGGNEVKIGEGGNYDARTIFLHPQRKLFEFRGAPVYLIDEVNSGQYDIHHSAMGWVGILAVPS